MKAAFLEILEFVLQACIICTARFVISLIYCIVTQFLLIKQVANTNPATEIVIKFIACIDTGQTITFNTLSNYTLFIFKRSFFILARFLTAILGINKIYIPCISNVVIENRVNCIIWHHRERISCLFVYRVSHVSKVVSPGYIPPIQTDTSFKTLNKCFRNISPLQYIIGCIPNNYLLRYFISRSNFVFIIITEPCQAGIYNIFLKFETNLFID